MKQRRISNSPLMDPSVCAVVLIAPDARGLASTVAASRPGLQRTLSAIMKAAGIADVPVFILSRDAQQQAVSLPPDIGIASARGQFVVQEHGSPWSHQGFVDALAAADRSTLVLAGFWLEHEILSTALHALVESYDVYVLLDATPPRSRLGSEPSRDRLNQAGAQRGNQLTSLPRVVVGNGGRLETRSAPRAAARSCGGRVTMAVALSRPMLEN